jgi:hypothetical protein
MWGPPKTNAGRQPGAGSNLRGVENLSNSKNAAPRQALTRGGPSHG